MNWKELSTPEKSTSAAPPGADHSLVGKNACVQVTSPGLAGRPRPGGLPTGAALSPSPHARNIRCRPNEEFTGGSSGLRVTSSVSATDWMVAPAGRSVKSNLKRPRVRGPFWVRPESTQACAPLLLVGATSMRLASAEGILVMVMTDACAVKWHRAKGR